MADTYIGVSGKARKVSDIYIGVSGKARRVIKGYIGDSNGKARLFFDSLVVLPVLNDNDWATISKASARGMAKNLWSVGDCKAITISGTVGTVSMSGTHYVYIMGFDHNGATNTIDFGTFKSALTGGKDYSIHTSSTSSTTNGTKNFSINHWGAYNFGGWAGCDLRYDVLGSTNVAPSGYGAKVASGRTGYNASSTCATSPVANTLMAALPADLRAVMKPMTIYTDNVAGKTNVSGNVTASVDYLPLLAEFEIYGARTNANSYEQNYQKQYAYFAAGNSRQKSKHNALTNNSYWWMRSPYYNTNSQHCRVQTGTSGESGYTGIGYSYGLAPIFRV